MDIDLDFEYRNHEKYIYIDFENFENYEKNYML